jgi:hypothetical protein
MGNIKLQGIFMTTNKGIPDLNNIPASATLAKSYYVCSVILQAILLLVFLLYFTLSVMRMIKKIKNSTFKVYINDD